MSFILRAAAACLRPPAPAGAAPVRTLAPQDHIQAGTNNWSFSVPISPTAGDTIILLTQRYARAGHVYSGVSDDQGGSWVLPYQNDPGDFSSWLAAYCSACPGGITQITVAGTGAAFGTNIGWIWGVDGGTIQVVDHFYNDFIDPQFHAQPAGISGPAGFYCTINWQSNAPVSYTPTPGWRNADSVVNNKLWCQDIDEESGMTAERARVDFPGRQTGFGVIAGVW